MFGLQLLLGSCGRVVRALGFPKTGPKKFFILRCIEIALKEKGADSPPQVCRIPLKPIELAEYNMVQRFL
jgi:hypothetical protein